MTLSDLIMERSCNTLTEEIVTPHAAFGGGPLILKRCCTPNAAFGGGTLRGSDIVRFVFVDEAGTSAKEPVSVVVGLVADADQHVRKAEDAMRLLLNYVPEEIRPGFVFHAIDLMGKKYDAVWPFQNRVAMLKNLMRLPRALGIAIAFGAVKRSRPKTTSVSFEMSKAQEDHMIAFATCISRADLFIRDKCAENEIGQIVAENIPEMRKHLKDVTHWMASLSQPHDYLVERIRSTVFFVNKDEDVLTQIVDACAYGLKRYLSGYRFGEEYLACLKGSPVKQDYLNGNIVGGAFHSSPEITNDMELTDEQRAAIERIDAEPDDTTAEERLNRLKGALSVSREAVEESLAKKEKSKRGRPPKSASGPSLP